jgi:hypothetical protein
VYWQLCWDLVRDSRCLSIQFTVCGLQEHRMVFLYFSESTQTYSIFDSVARSGATFGDVVLVQRVMFCLIGE